MNETIALANLKDDHLGFMLVAGEVPLEYLSLVGEWMADCIFMGLPFKVELIESPGYIVISELHVEGEHRVDIVNNGHTVTYDVAGRYCNLHLLIGEEGIGEWRVRKEGVESKFGIARWVVK